jgi:hypothetical protein
MLKRLIALAALTTSLALAVALYSHGTFSQTIDDATLSGKAALAVARGESEVHLGINDAWESVNTLDEALSHYTVVEATAISKQSYVLDQYGIGTWYRLRIERTIKQNALPECSSCGAMPDPPADTPTLNWNEIMLLRAGGIQVVDGVTFFVNVPDFPDFSLNQRYLLFIDYDPSKKVGLVSVGPPGVYMVNGTGGLSHIYDSDVDDPICSGLAGTYGNNANTLYNALNPPPPPPECDPIEEQNCWNSGGSWDSFSCYCTPSNQCGGYLWNCY